jgi:hypothetical protein
MIVVGESLNLGLLSMTVSESILPVGIALLLVSDIVLVLFVARRSASH